MDKNTAIMLRMSRRIEAILRPRFPWLSDETIRNHAEAAAITLIQAMVEDAALMATGAGAKDVCIEYSWRVR